MFFYIYFSDLLSNHVVFLGLLYPVFSQVSYNPLIQLLAQDLSNVDVEHGDLLGSITTLRSQISLLNVELQAVAG